MGKGKLRKALEGILSSWKNERQHPDYASNPKVKRKAGMGLGEIVTSGLFLSQPNALTPSFQNYLHGESTQRQHLPLQISSSCSSYSLSSPDAPTSVSSCSLLLCPMKSFFFFLIIKVIQIHGRTF